jgi:hypothetical protein
VWRGGRRAEQFGEGYISIARRRRLRRGCNQPTPPAAYRRRTCRPRYQGLSWALYAAARPRRTHSEESEIDAGQSRPRRRGDRIGDLMSLIGTFETCRRALNMSVHWGRPEVVVGRQNGANDPKRTDIENRIISARGYFGLADWSSQSERGDVSTFHKAQKYSRAPPKQSSTSSPPNSATRTTSLLRAVQTFQQATQVQRLALCPNQGWPKHRPNKLANTHQNPAFAQLSTGGAPRRLCVPVGAARLAKVKECASALPSPTFFTLPECDHITALVRSDLVIPQIKAFLSKVGL